MNIVKTTSFAVVCVVASLAVASIFGFQLSEITAEETEDKGYKFGEGVSVTGEFLFREGPQVYTFEVFEQKSGFDRAEPFVFELQGIVGDTPILHKHADESFFYRSSEHQKKQNNPFNVNVILSSGGDAKRVFTYNNCHISDYMVETLFDKEEAWMGKGFAILDAYEIQCTSYKPHNPQYAEMMTSEVELDTESSMDLKEPFETWSEHFKYSGKY